MSVLKPWVARLPWKEQSVLISGMRGPDIGRTVHLQAMTRWLRAVLQHNADSTTDYMKGMLLPRIAELAESLEFTTVHYFCHLLHGLEIVGYRGPLGEDADVAREYYLGLVAAVHLQPESAAQMKIRLASPGDEEE